jgi:enediyne biosynthesis protein E4
VRVTRSNAAGTPGGSQQAALGSHWGPEAPTLCAAFLVALMGCGSPSGTDDSGYASAPAPTSPSDTAASADSHTGFTDTTPTETGIVTRTTGDTSAAPDTATEPDETWTYSGPVVCPDPAPRAERAFDEHRLPHQTVTGNYLTGAGIVSGDFTGDGAVELFLPGEFSMQMWTTEGGVFREITTWALPGLSLPNGVGGAAADHDNDGDLDILLTRFDDTSVLLDNDGHGTFEDISEGTGLEGTVHKSQSASWADIDLDGDLDLVVGNYGPHIPDAFEPYLERGDPSELYLNNGDGTFTDISDQLTPTVHDGHVFMTGWFDVDGDQLPELFTVHDFGWARQSTLLWNRGGGVLESDSELELPTGFHPNFGGMGFAVGDLNGDELPDFIQTSSRDISALLSSETALTTEGYMWTEWQEPLGFSLAEDQDFGWAAELVDIDNDTDLDVLALFGHWTAYPKPLPQERDGLWLNHTDCVGADFCFEQRAGDIPWHLDHDGAGRGLVSTDLNGDGSLDLVKRELDGPTLVMQSRCGSEGWVVVRPRQAERNRFAIGAKVRVTHGDSSQVRWLHSGSASMYSSAPPEVHFGLGDHKIVDTLEVIWPDGTVSTAHDVEPRQVVTVLRP